MGIAAQLVREAQVILNLICITIQGLDHTNAPHTTCLQKSNLAVTEKQLDDLIEIMDDDKNGEIDLKYVPK